jgi:hypothetical protein
MSRFISCYITSSYCYGTTSQSLCFISQKNAVFSVEQIETIRPSSSVDHKCVYSWTNQLVLLEHILSAGFAQLFGVKDREGCF